MGTSASKIGQEDSEKVSTGSVPTTPILTPKDKNKKPLEKLIDPRSPSCNIIRTPIQSAICEQLIAKSESACDTFNINSPELMKTIDDPRSPTLAFTRTPITIVEETNLLRKLHKKNLDNIKKVISDMPSQVPPKLLESSPIKPKLNENKRKSLVGLLETNLDFVETDLDVVIMSKSSPQSFKAPSPNKAELKAKFLHDLQNDENTTQETCKTQQDLQENGQEVLVQEESEIRLEIPQNLQTDVADNGLIIPEEEPMPTVIEVTPKKELINNVQEFEKTIANLIYTDGDHINTTPSINKTATQQSNGGCRTPLGTRNGDNSQQLQKKSIPKLRVSDKPRRTNYAVSKIPVFKTKNKQQCENTPPKNMNESGRKTKRAQWDNDNTLII